MPRVKAHFKSHLSLGNHTKTAAMFADNDMLALWLRLGHLAMERRAARTADIFVVRDEELQGLTGKHRADVARKYLGRLADITPISVERRGDVWSIHWPNYAEKQGFDTKNYGPQKQKQKHTKSTSPSDSLSPEAKPIPDDDGGKTTKSRGSAQEGDLMPTRTDGRVQDVRRTWPECVRVAGQYGKRWGKNPPKGVEVKMAARLRDNPSSDPDILVRAIHGAVKFWQGNDDPDRMVAAYLRPQTIYQASKFDGYVAANEQATPQRSKGNGRQTDGPAAAYDRAASRLGLDEGGGEESPRTIDITPDRDRRQT